MSNKDFFEETKDQAKTDAGSGSFVKDLFSFMWERKLWWMVPMIVVLVLVAVLLMVASSAGPAAPFIYSLF